MIGILKIDLPDDFEKGDYKSCQLAKYADGNKIYTPALCRYTCRTCTPWDCPLEIQDDDIPSERYIGPCVLCKHRKHCQEWRGSDTCRYEPIGE